VKFDTKTGDRHRVLNMLDECRVSKRRKVKVKVKFALQQAVSAQKGSKGSSTFSLT
jgi:hypothetical protein